MTRVMRASLVSCLFLLLVLAAGQASEAKAAPLADGQKCTMSGDKVASPTRILLGETVQIRLTLDPTCPPAVYRKADIALVIDRSLSMADSNKLEGAKAAAVAFVDNTDLTMHRIGVISFAADAYVAPIGLSQNRDRILDAIDDIEIRPSTNISAGLDAGQSLLAAEGRADASPFLIVLSDGSPNGPRPDPRAAAVVSANFAKLAGTEIFSVAFGSDADLELMKNIASSPQHYYDAPTNDDLEEIYELIAVVVGTSVVRDLTLDDDLTADVVLEAGSAVPDATVNGKRVTWQAVSLPDAGLTWTYVVKPQRVGTYPTNVQAVATYTNADGEEDTFVFPIPQITVVDPADKTCTQPGEYTVQVHAFPDVVGRGPYAGQGCNIRFDSGDWMAGSWPAVPELEFELIDDDDEAILYQGKAVKGAGRIDQRLHIAACEPPPWRIRLVSPELNGWQVCPNSPSDRLIRPIDLEQNHFNSIEVKFGLYR